MDPELTTLIAKPRKWQQVQRWPGTALFVAGVWSMVYEVEAVALAFIVVGFWGMAEFWRGVRVTGDQLIAQGRVSRRVVPLAEITQVGSTPGKAVWVSATGRRTLVLHQAELRQDQPGRIIEIRERLREVAEQAGAELGPPQDGPTRAPWPNTPVFGW